MIGGYLMNRKMLSGAFALLYALFSVNVMAADAPSTRHKNIRIDGSQESGASLNIQHGTDPTSPVNGDVWTTSAAGILARINGATKTLADLESAQAISGVKTFSAIPIMSLGVQITETTVGSLGTCDAGATGTIKYVTDASGPTYGATLAGGGAVRALALCDGTNWTAH